ncbi:sensor histidine kinase [Poseidonibacter lekithochrous]|uniref:sensor histidine kinase n=1 Tax=Poseidonibacter lekithochrous TaxID=1904463 RepID=UPI0008FC5760|nr:HAMP domain-containing sensor histidine kinase [Poseidonibacter lekithochrous]QKJ23305.1 two-component system sensor histidine kinase [Poseidonibacter lekithochrous]
MKIKTFVVVLSTIAGLIVSIFTAVMTFVIIGEPICSVMLIKITVTVLSVLPVIAFLSLFAGTYMSKKFKFIEYRLEKIRNQKFNQEEEKHYIREVQEMHDDINFLSNQLEDLIGDLRQKNHNLSNLLISMSHDIKTPITIINGYIEEIEDGLVTPQKMPAALKHMKKEVEFLDELTIDMLEFISSMEQYKTKEKIMLYYFIKNEVFPLLPQNDKVKLLSTIDKDYVVKFNKVDLKKICVNILSNAIKYTKEGYVKVSALDNNILFENNGEEIKDEFKDKIFEPFFTISTSKNRKDSGFGLGLSIVTNLSKNNDYKCTLDSSTKEKTVFSLEAMS